jgi:hypothetical protein
MNFHARNYEAELVAHYAAVRMRLRAPEYETQPQAMLEPAEPVLLLEYLPPAES